jgi:hypothetical protein
MFSQVSTTLANNPCHGLSMIVGVVDNGDKFLTGVSGTGEQLSLVTMTPANNYRR